MVQKVDGSFVSYEFTPEEIVAAATFSDLNRMYLQSQLAGIAEQKLALVFDPANPLQYAQEEAFLKGQMTMLQFLLDHNPQSSTSNKE